jgi:hypothetical protein
MTGLTSAHYVMRRNGAFRAITNDAAAATEEFGLQSVDAGACLACGVGERELFCAPCGHRAFCRGCRGARAAVCPLCRSPLARVSEGFRSRDDGACLICLTEKSDGIVLPCGHIDCCAGCLVQWFRTHAACPTCNSENVTFKKVIPDY